MGDPSGDSSDDVLTATPLLETKLFVPKWRSGLVARPRLSDQIRRGLDRKLTVVSAPAGFGKTTLLVEWLASDRAHLDSVAWVSLDASENESALFWAYVIKALQRVNPSVGRRAYARLHAPQQSQMRSIVAVLINEIAAVDADFILILDDYHVIENATLHDEMSFLLDHLPPRMHVVVTCRSYPDLPLARFRARGELLELHANDLRFTANEASAFLNQTMSLDLSTTEMATLAARTEGWIAGLKLAALSLHGRADARGLVDAFTGGNRNVADYLVEEVLLAQPARVRAFLLDTSILDRLNGSLCEAVTGEENAQQLLVRLERENLFVVPLDERREWYRYHHLFAEVLRSLAAREDPGRVSTAHRRASGWFEQRGLSDDAVRHALDGGDPDRAARLLELERPAMDRSFRAARWLDRVRILPDDVVRVRPILSMSYAWALLNSGELEAVEDRLRDVERWLGASAAVRDGTGSSAAHAVDLDAAGIAALPVELKTARVYLAQALGDIPGTVENASQALNLIPADNDAARATGAALLGLAHWANGDLEVAFDTFADALACMRSAGEHLGAIRGTFVLGDIRVAQGRLQDAAAIYQRTLKLAKAQVSPGAIAETDELYQGLADVHREWRDLESAEKLLLDASETDEPREHGGNRQRWCMTMARVLQARGALDAALHLLDEAESLHVRDPLPRARPVAAMKARVWIEQGRLLDALGWVRERGLSTEDELIYIREFEHLTLARFLIASSGSAGSRTIISQALTLLDRLQAAAEAGGRTGSLIETLVLQAVSYHVMTDGHAALGALERALALAEPEGYVSVFVDEGHRMHDLLRTASARGRGGEYARHVLSAVNHRTLAATTRRPTPGADLIEPLTTREREILQLIAEGLRNQEIADRLFISAATVKRHIANTYGKLGVSHRTEALVRARELKLL